MKSAKCTGGGPGVVPSDTVLIRLRIIFALSSAALLAAEIYIGIFVRDGFVRPYLGDTLVVMLLYCIVRIVFPTGAYWLSGAVFLFAVLVEISQIFPLCDLLGIRSGLIRTLMGTSFSLGDIAAYFAGNVITGSVDFILWRKLGRMSRN